MDFPHGKGVVREELLVTPSASHRKAMETLRPVVIDTRRDELETEASQMVAAEDIKAFCIIPLVNRGRFLGNLSISRKTETPFTPEDLDFLSRVSGQIAIALENALAYREICELKDKLENALNEGRMLMLGGQVLIGAVAGLAVIAAGQWGASTFALFWVTLVPLAILTAIKPNLRLSCVTLVIVVLVPAPGNPFARPFERVVEILVGVLASIVVSAATPSRQRI